MIYAKTQMEKLPRSCAECKLGDKYGYVGDVRCKVLEVYFTGNVEPPHKERPDECPLVVDAVEVVHGRWKYYDFYMRTARAVFECNLCKRAFTGTIGFNYCPNCGAKMDSKEGEQI